MTATLSSILLLALILSTAVVGKPSNETFPNLLEEFKKQLDKWRENLAEIVEYLYHSLIEFLKAVGRMIYLTLGIVGFVLWATGFSRYTGRRLLYGAILLAFLIGLLV